MCAICGIVSSNLSYNIPQPVLTRMRDIMAHRGPDDFGSYSGPGVGLGSRRLAVLDLSQNGRMPMSTLDDRFWITHNGEIYNYRSLRSSLCSDGYKFRSNTDTEVLLNLYTREGPSMLERLNGMFAFAIWDNQKRRLFLARDRLGIKPVYYATYKDAFYFASEEKALFAAGVPREFDHRAWEELICFRYVAGEHTPFVGIRRLLPGHYLVWQDGDVQIHRWWNLADKARALRDNLPGDPVSWYRDVFDDAIGCRRISDVPIGVLLSGGLDSSSVAASLAEQAGSGISSFTIRFDERDYDEGPLAQQVAERSQLDSHELIVPPTELPERLREASWLNDEPLVHGNDLHLLAISQYAKHRVTVLLSGEGADETLGGYVRYQPLRYPVLLSLMKPWLPSICDVLSFSGRLRKLGRFLKLGPLDRFVILNACDVLPADVHRLGFALNAKFAYREQVLTEARTLYPDEYVRQAMYCDQHTFLCSILDRNDRMTMGASIECRVPFLDYRLVEAAAALPSSLFFAGRRGKELLRAAIGYRLPRAVLAHRKWGFGVPWKLHLREVDEFRSLLHDLSNAQLILDSPLQRSAVKEQVGAFLKGNDQSFRLVMQMLMIVLAWETAKSPKPNNQRLGVAI